MEISRNLSSSINYLDVLSDEMVIQILDYLDFPELCQCSMVYKKWSVLSEDETLSYPETLGSKIFVKALKNNCFEELVNEKNESFRRRRLFFSRAKKISTKGAPYDIKITGAVLNALPGSVERLSLNVPYLSDKGVVPLSSFTELRRLSLSVCTELTNKAVIALNRLPHLESLSLKMAYKINGGCFPFLPRSLKKFDVSHCTIKDHMVKFLPKGLESLQLNYCQGITIVGLRNLPESLRYLGLMTCWEISSEEAGVFADERPDLKLSYFFDFS